MPSMLVFDPSREEISMIREEVANICMNREEPEFHSAGSLQELVRRAGELEDISMYCSDFDAGGETAVKIVKDETPDALTVVIAGMQTPPTRYVRPSIMPAGLLLRPFLRGQVESILREVLETVWVRERENVFQNAVFTYTSREGIIRVPYAKILFFEARNKKVVLCTQRMEQSFYASLDGLMDRIPGYFMRCHNAYIVNTLLVERVDLAQSQLQMLGGLVVPVSRSYRTAVREALA